MTRAAATASDVLLVGQPNVGKSVLFSRMTGVRTMASNYPGTTVSYAVGKMRAADHNFVVVDAPGTYSLEPLDEAARVTTELIGNADRIINVVDSTRLERHLPLTLELIAAGKPIVVALNMSDEAKHQGITIDAGQLSQDLGVPVLPITARSGEGVRALTAAICAVERPPECPPPAELNAEGRAHDGSLNHSEIWRRVGKLVERAQTIVHHHHSLGERLEELSIHPVWGSAIAVLVVAASFSLVRMLGEFLIGGTVGIVGTPWAEIPFGTEHAFNGLVAPLLLRLSGALGPETFLHRLLIGSLVDGGIDFEQSFGILTSGLYIPIGVVFPYLISFYLVLSLLEDTGYLPRLAVFLDSVMHRLGLHGYAIIPTLLGLGCNVPGIMATRVLETPRQRFITATLISIAVPCAALQAMIVGIVGSRSVGALAVVYGTLAVVWVLISLILRFVSHDFRPELLVEIPPYRLPTLRGITSKLWMRVSGFFREALPIVIGAVVVVNLLYQADVFERLAALTEPVLSRLWGMPKEAILPLLVGIVRKDIAMGLFAPLQLTTKQLITGAVLLSMFFPCMAGLVVLFRELRLRNGLASLGIMLAAVFVVGIALNVVL